MNKSINSIDEQIKSLQQERKKLLDKVTPDAYISLCKRKQYDDLVEIRIAQMRFGEYVKTRMGDSGSKKYHALNTFSVKRDCILSDTKKEIEKIKSLLDDAYANLEKELLE